jgi:hypothetical protein
MRESIARNGQRTHDDTPIQEWRAVDAYTVRRTAGPVVSPLHRRHWDGVDLVLGLLSLAVIGGALWGWVWAVGAVLLPAWRALWGG